MDTSISNLASAIADRKNSDRKNSETLSQNGAGVPSLADQINQLNCVITSIISSHTKQSASNNSSSNVPQNLPEPQAQSNRDLMNLNNLVNSASLDQTGGGAGGDLDIENVDLNNLELTRSIIMEQNRVLQQLRCMVQEKDENIVEMKSKFSKHRQILTSNWQQAEDEVRKVDDIYHSTIQKVISTVESLPENIGGTSALTNLVTSLRQDQLQAETVVKAENLANGNTTAVEEQQLNNVNNSDGINGNQQQQQNNKKVTNGGGLPLTTTPTTNNLKSKSDLLLSRSCKDNFGENGGISDSTTSTINSMMSQSMLIESVNNKNNTSAGNDGSLVVGGIRLKSGVLSEPCLQKAPMLGGIPTTALLTSPERLKQQEDLNANQSL